MRSKFTKLFLLSSLITISSTGFSHGESGHSFVDPKFENPGIPVPSYEEGLSFQQGLTQEQFNESIDSAESAFDKAGFFKAYGASVEYRKDWESKVINAQAEKEGSKWWILMYGGLARHKLVDQDVFEGVICHELGHLLAGWPQRRGNSSDQNGLIGSEGNSDYYAIFACAEFLWQDQDEKNAAARENVKPENKKFCDEVYPDEEALQNKCYRKVTASFGLASLLAELGREKAVSLEEDKLDASVVTRSNPYHPKAQCRFDTYRAAAACKKYESWNHESYPSNKEELSAQTCDGTYPESPLAVIKEGFRPKCWFKP